MGRFWSAADWQRPVTDGDSEAMSRQTPELGSSKCQCLTLKSSAALLRSSRIHEQNFKLGSLKQRPKWLWPLGGFQHKTPRREYLVTDGEVAGTERDCQATE